MGNHSQKLKSKKMKNSLLTLFVFIQISAFAQPVFNFNNLIGDSDELSYKKAIIDGGLGILDGNQIWNFTGLDNDTGEVVALRDLSQFPVLNAPADANKFLVKTYESSALPNNQSNFYKADTSGLYQLTMRTNELNYVAFSTPYKELIFPVVYNPDQILSNTSLTFTDIDPFSEGDSIRTHRNIDLYYSVPAYGTLSTPNYQNIQVLLVQRLEAVTDSVELYQNGVWTSFPSETYFIDYYDFISPSEGYYILRAKTIEGEKGTAYEIYHLVSRVIIGVDEVDNKRVSIYPNPANDFIHIQTDLPIKNVELLDLHGRKVKGWMSSQENILQVSDLNAGFYFLKYTVGVQSFTNKIIIQH